MSVVFTPLQLLQGDSGTIFYTGIVSTLELTALAGCIAFLIGPLLAVIRASGPKLASGFVVGYVAYHRNIPLLVQILFWYFGITALLPGFLQSWLNQHGGGFLCGAIAIGLCMAAYVSEDLRSGMRAISTGQFEAARAMGLNFIQTMRYVVIPQALRHAIPSLVNEMLLLLKNTSLLMAIGVAELTYVTRQIETQTFRTFEIFALATVCYLAISFLIMLSGRALEHHFKIIGR
jgi:polar amino acid transport system permease protein